MKISAKEKFRRKRNIDFWNMCKVTKFPKVEWEPFVEDVKAKAEETKRDCLNNGFKFADLCVDYAQSMLHKRFEGAEE